MKMLLWSLMLLPAISLAQKDPCKKIVRNENRDNGAITYLSPAFKYVTMIKQCQPDTVFALLLNMHDAYGHYDVTGVAIEFDDSTVLKDEQAKIICRQEMANINSGMGSGSSFAEEGGYILQSYIQIDTANVERFIAHKLVRIQIDNISKKIPEKDAVKLQQYASCLKNIR